MFSSASAIVDEPTLGPIPTNAELGRQVKRIKTANRLSSCPDTPMVTDGVTGDRFARATNMAIEMAGNNPQGDVRNQALIAAVGAAINAACGPGGAIHGAIHGAIQVACAPGGAIHGAIQDGIQVACRPGGAIQTAIETVDKRSLARQHNGRVHEADGYLQGLPDGNGIVPVNFPATYDAFGRMSADTANGLLLAYGLEPAGTLRINKQLLSAYCNVNLPR